MTLIAGFHCRDGLLLCADTQETIAGYTKIDTDKISGTMCVGGCIMLAGAGDSMLIDMVNDRLVDHFILDRCPADDWRGMEKQIKSVLIPLFEDQARRNSFLPEMERPEAELLIGYRAKDSKMLLKVTGTRISRVRAAQCFGTGVLIANGLVKRLFDLNMTLKQAGLLAVYVFSQAKRFVDGVGGNTDILFIGEWGFTRIPTTDIEKIEAWWREVEAAGISFVHAITGASQIDRLKVAALADLKDSIAFYDEIYERVDEVLNPTQKPEAGSMVTKIIRIGGRRFFQSEGVGSIASNEKKAEPEP